MVLPHPAGAITACIFDAEGTPLIHSSPMGPITSISVDARRAAGYVDRILKGAKPPIQERFGNKTAPAAWLDVPKNLSWLDVGCGNGAFTEELIARCAPAAVTAIDPSDDQIAYARTRPGARMTDFCVGDAQNLLFDDNSFDVAAMALVISSLPDPGKAVAEMARVVRPGGWVATSCGTVSGAELQSTRFT